MTSTLKTMTTMMVAVCFAGAGRAVAQMPQQAQPQQAQPQQMDEGARTKILNELSALQERSRTVQEELTAIAQKAVEANPSLMDKHKKLMSLYQGKLTEHGYPSDEELEALRDAQQKLQTPGAADMDEAERQRLADQFNAGVAKLQEAQQRAQNDPEVQKAQAEFDKARLEAMQNVDPKATELHSEHERLQSKIEGLRQSLHSALQQAPQR